MKKTVAFTNQTASWPLSLFVKQVGRGPETDFWEVPAVTEAVPKVFVTL